MAQRGLQKDHNSMIDGVCKQRLGSTARWETELLSRLCWGEAGLWTWLSTAQRAQHSQSMAPRAGTAEKLLLWIYIGLYILKGGHLRVILRSRNSLCVEAKRGDIRTDKVINIILRHLGMERKAGWCKSCLRLFKRYFYCLWMICSKT